MFYKQIITAAILLVVLPPVFAKSLKSSLIGCGEIEANEQRLVCFDKLLDSQTVKSNAEHQSPAPITDEIGLAIPKEESDQDVEYSVVITKCESSSSSKRLFFYLDNGQVWRQKNAKWLSKRDCQSNGGG
jgi:hypothetical protein